MTTPNERIFEVQIKHSVYLERYKSGIFKKIIGLLNASEADLIAEIATRLVKIEQWGYDLGADSTSGLQALVKTIQDRRTKVYVVLEGQLTNELNEFAQYETDFRSDWLTMPGSLLIWSLLLMHS